MVRKTRHFKKVSIRSGMIAAIVLLLAILTPVFVAGIADGMNGVVGGGSKVKWTLASESDSSKGINIAIGPYTSAYDHGVMYYHKNSAGLNIYSPQTVFYSNVLGEDYNELIVSSADVTHDAARNDRLMIGLSLTPTDFIEKGIENLSLSLRVARSVVVSMHDPASSSEINYGALTTGGLQFVGSDGSTVKGMIIPLTLSTNSTHGHESGGMLTLNLTAGQWQDYSLKVSRADVLKAATYLGDLKFQGTILTIRNSGNAVGQSLIEGDDVQFKVVAYGPQINGYAVNEVFIGLFGGTMLVGGVLSTPFVNLRGRKSPGGRK